jgi:poly(3-hydroxybutyrate) depolymerase
MTWSPRAFGFLAFILSACGSSSGTTASEPDAGPVVVAASISADASADVAIAEAGPSDAGLADAKVVSVCESSSTRVKCPYKTHTIESSARRAHYALPGSAAGAKGFPLVFLFQGSFFSGENYFEAGVNDPYGGLYQAQLVKALLDAGFAVLAPETRLAGSTYWDTNVLPWAQSWAGAPDDTLMKDLFAAIGAGTFGAIDSTRLYAAGISSGGYMTSRMAVSYAGKFRALAIHSASYATCGGSLCLVPSTLPADHPPTLFLHGGADFTVPVATMTSYADALAKQGIPERRFVEQSAGHAWLTVAPSEITAWFVGHP